MNVFSNIMVSATCKPNWLALVWPKSLLLKRNPRESNCLFLEQCRSHNLYSEWFKKQNEVTRDQLQGISKECRKKKMKRKKTSLKWYQNSHDSYMSLLWATKKKTTISSNVDMCLGTQFSSQYYFKTLHNKESESAMQVVINGECRCLNKGEPREMKSKSFHLISFLKIFSNTKACPAYVVYKWMRNLIKKVFLNFNHSPDINTFEN